VFSVGLLLVFGGLLALAVSGVKAGIVRWAAPLPVLGMLVCIAGGDQGGSIALAVVWLVIAAHVDRPAAAALPAAATAG
jgi:hypothetical protein